MNIMDMCLKYEVVYIYRERVRKGKYRSMLVYKTNGIIHRKYAPCKIVKNENVFYSGLICH